MTKKHADMYNNYVSSIRKHDRRSLYQFYGKCSNRKVIAWQEIAKRCVDCQGIGLTVIGGSSYSFSTGYIKRVTGGAVLVYDTIGGTHHIPLSAEQRQEVSRLLCLTV